mmetsp:Transcript_27936/g.65689  ORF Transcript_27936/g.65689 Transcript_27936/m.65689 type:complete len:214 (+) Transcript_27936:775-1416(+)
MHCPLRTSHSLTVSSKDPLTRRLLAGLNWQQNTKLSWPRNSTRPSEVCASHNRMVLSSLAVATKGSSPFDQHTSLMPRLCPTSVALDCIAYSMPRFAGNSGSLRSQILTLPSALAEAQRAALSFVKREGANWTLDTARLCSPYIGRQTKGEASVSDEDETSSASSSSSLSMGRFLDIIKELFADCCVFTTLFDRVLAYLEDASVQLNDVYLKM